MSKGSGHAGNKKSSSYEFKKRCCVIGCKKRAKYQINDKFYCKKHAN